MIPRAVLELVLTEIKPKFPNLTMIVLLAADDEGVSIAVQAREDKQVYVPTAIRMAADMVEDEPADLL
jgi:hypothetical protein